MRPYPTRATVNAAKIEYYREQIAKVKEPKTYIDWAMLRLYKQIVEQYDKNQEQAVIR